MWVMFCRGRGRGRGIHIILGPLEIKDPDETHNARSFGPRLRRGFL